MTIRLNHEDGPRVHIKRVESVEKVRHAFRKEAQAEAMS